MLWHRKSKKLTLEELIPGGETYRYAENLYGLQWRRTYQTKYRHHLHCSTQNRERDMLTTSDKSTKYWQTIKQGNCRPRTQLPVGGQPQQLKVSGKYIVYDFENNRIVSTLKLKDKAANEDYCVANGNVAYTA